MFSLQPTKVKTGKKKRMKIIFQTKLAGFTPILAQTTGSLSSGASSALGIVMLIGFIFGTICVVGGGFAIRRGDADTGKLSIIGGLIIAGAPVIVKALFVAFGIGSSTANQKVPSQSSVLIRRASLSSATGSSGFGLASPCSS